MSSYLSRRQINLICDSIAEKKNMDGFSSYFTNRNIKEQIKSQLIEINVNLSDNSIEMLKGFISKRIFLSNIHDDELIGNRSAEANSASISDLSMDAFKATEKNITLPSIVAQMSSIMATTKNRNDQRVIVHFDRDYATEMNNFNLREVSDMRYLFASTKIKDLVREQTIGVLTDFDQDRVSKNNRAIKKELIDKYSAPIIEHGIWNIIDAISNSKTLAKKSILCIRLEFNITEMYKRSIGLPEIAEFIGKSINSQLKTCEIIPSSFKEGIIDILPGSISGYDEQAIYIHKTIIQSLDAVISGIPQVKEANVEKINLFSLLLSSNYAQEYYVAELGRKKIAPEISWDKIEYESIIVKKDDKSFDDDSIILGEVYRDETIMKIIYPASYYNTSNIDKPTEREMTEVYINKYTSNKGMKNLWVLTLDYIKMRLNCVDIDLIKNLINFSGLDIYSTELCRTSDDKRDIRYIYIYSERNPKDIIKIHIDEKYYSLESNFIGTEIRADSLVSERSLKYIKNKAKDGSLDSISSYISNIRINVLSRLSHYYYIILECEKKNPRKASAQGSSPITENVSSRVYVDIISFPFVDRFKTTSNDWYTMCYVLGADAARNNYVLEPYILFSKCGIKQDPRHIELLGDYIFERGVPAGVSVYGAATHGKGTTSEAMISNAYDKFINAYNREPERAEIEAVSNLLGSVPAGTKDRESVVKMFDRMKRDEEERTEIKKRRLAKFKGVDHIEKPTASDSISLSVRSMFIDIDPYYSIPLVEITNFTPLQVPEDIFVKTTEPNKDILSIVKAMAVSKLSLIKNMKPAVISKSSIINVSPEFQLLDAEKLYIFFQANQDIFSS
jgi:hypothetical protein